MTISDLFFGPVAITLVLGLTLIVLLYWSSVRHYSYWKKRGIPSANAIPVLGSLYEALRTPLQDVEYKRYKELGRVYGHFEGSKPVLSIAEPTLLREILVKDFPFFHDRRHFDCGDKVLNQMLSVIQGEDWKRVRSIVTPTFSTGKIKRMMKIFTQCSKTMIQNFKTESEAGKYIEMKRLYAAFTMDLIASSAFSTVIDSHDNPDNKFVQIARRLFKTNNWRFVIFFISPRLMKALRISLVDQVAMDFFKDVIHQIVEERRKTGKRGNDFIQFLMDTAEEVSEQEKWESQDKEKEEITSNFGRDDIAQQILQTATSKHLSMDELVAMCVIFFLAGYDTTSSTLSFATYSLAVYPEVQDKLRKEVDKVLKENNGELNYEAIQNLKYLDCVISETLRLYPPSFSLERAASADYVLGDTGITIPKGMLISIPVYAMHRDPEFFPDPEKFDPERFTSEERSMRNPYTYLPFGAGPRNCVGMRFALMVIKVALACIIANFIIKKCPETQVPVEFYIAQSLLQPKKIILEMEIRKESPLVSSTHV